MTDSVTIMYPYDLRASLNEKHQETIYNNSWTCFVNNAGTIGHLMHPDEFWIIRLRFRPNVKSCSVSWIEKKVVQMVDRYVKL